MIPLISLLKELGAEPTDRFLLAVSGGPDSMALAGLFQQLLPNGQWEIAHYNHRLRAEDSNADEKLVCQFAKLNRIPVSVERAPTPTPATEWPSEDTLRQLRYGFLERTRQAKGLRWIVTAHHSQDQVETFFMRLLRGTSLTGLRAIMPVNGSILRPLLNVAPETLLQFLNAQRIPFREDASNQSPHYLRNRVRHELLPLWLSLSPGDGSRSPSSFDKILAVRDDAQSLWQRQREIASQFLESHAVTTPLWVRWRCDPFESLQPTEQIAVLQILWQTHQLPPMDRSGWRSLIQQITSRARCTVPRKGVRFIISCDWIYLLRQEKPQLEWRRESAKSFCCDALGLALSLDGTPQQLEPSDWEVRFPLAGDRIRSTKLAKVFLERRIPAPERSWIPVICAPQSNQILWYLGCAPGEASSIEPRHRGAFPFCHLTS